MKNSPIKTFQDLDSFTQGYLEAMYFCVDGSAMDEEGAVRASGYAVKTLRIAAKVCAQFQEENQEALYDYYFEGAYGSAKTQGGHDFYLTRNGHGTGFWDAYPKRPCHDLLSAAAHAYGESYDSISTRGLLHTQEPFRKVAA